MNSFRTQTDAKNNGYLLTKDVEMIIYADTIGLGSLIISMIIFWFFAHALLFVFLEPDDYRDFSWGSVNSGLLLIYGLMILGWFFLKN